MTGVLNHRIYITNCCKSEIRIANYASTNASTIFTTPLCECKKTNSVVGLELIRIDTPTTFKLADGGVDNYELPSFFTRT